MGTPIPFLTGERLILRILDVSDCEGSYPEWLNDPEVSKFNSHHVLPYDREAAKDYVAGLRNRRDALVLAIVSRSDNVHIGNIALDRINLLHGTAELTIMIGSKPHWNKGLSKEAASLLCRHGFESLNLHRIECATRADNQGMRKLAEYLGMRQEGNRRQAVLKEGTRHDLVEYGVLRDEFYAKFK
ncbi:MAG: GNAT family N-acetyltransferase [Leptospirales bacterium]|nr:GNAT family N-acetyltransferase [Leptospirales bacterium]